MNTYHLFITGKVIGIIRHKYKSPVSWTFSFFFFLKIFIYLFIYFWLCWVFVSVRGLSPLAASGGHSSSRCTGLSLSRPLLLRSTGSRRAGSVIVAHGPSCSATYGIFPDQGSNPCPLHWQADSQPLRHQGSPWTFSNGVFSLSRVFIHGSMAIFSVSFLMEGTVDLLSSMIHCCLAFCRALEFLPLLAKCQ